MTKEVVNVLVMAPHLGLDLGYIEQVDPAVRVLDGNSALSAELIAQGRLPGPLPESAPSKAERDLLISEADVLLVGFPIPTRLVDRAPSLRWAHHTQAGVSNLLGSDLWSSEVQLTSSRGAVGVRAIAEYVIAGVFHFFRGLHDPQSAAGASSLVSGGHPMKAVKGATMGVVGLGGIGLEVARLARSVGMRVVATRRSLREPVAGGSDVDLALPASELLELVAQSDVVALCSQLTPETRGMMDESVFGAMKPGAVFINVARGEEVDETALLSSIRSGRLRGALLDVYDGESAGQPPRPELLESPLVVFTPHVSSFGDPEGHEPVKRLFVDNLRRYIEGAPLVNLVDRERGY